MKQIASSSMLLSLIAITQLNYVEKVNAFTVVFTIEGFYKIIIVIF